MDEVQLAHLIEEEGDDDDEDISDFDEEDGSNGGSSDDDLEDFDVQVSIHLAGQMCFSFHVQWYTSCWLEIRQELRTQIWYTCLTQVLADYYMLIYSHYEELMKSMGSHGEGDGLLLCGWHS